MTAILPTFQFDDVFLAPWRDDFGGVLRILLMGFFTNAACGLVGTFLVIRRMALTGDAISHSLLPGIVIAFLLTNSRGIFPMLLGAILAGVLCVLLVELIHRQSRVKHDAALGIVFSSLFALGVILLSLYADQIDLDPDCVLYGEIGFIPFMPDLTIGDIPIGPYPLVTMVGVFTVCLILIILFYRGLLVTSFDPALATSLGIRSSFYHYGLMVVVSITVVSAFEAVGAILVVAMLIFPAITASLLFTRLPHILVTTIPLAFFYSLGGFHLALWLDTSIAGAMVLIAGLIFTTVWLAAPQRGLLAIIFLPYLRRRRPHDFVNEGS